MTNRHVLAGVALLAASMLAGCHSQLATPPEVQAAYTELVASLDPEAPGLSLMRLKYFAQRHARYQIASTVERDVAAWQIRLQPAYLAARDLVRDGQFDQAERVLADLALVPDEPAGKQSSEFLAFEFHRVKASRLLVAGDAAGAERAARSVIGQPLGDQQQAAAQQLLDAAALATLGTQMTMTTALQSSARTLQVFLHSQYADNGQYPEHLTLEDPQLSQLLDLGALGAIGALEDYKATPDTFSVVVVGKGTGQRLRITQRGIEQVPAAPQP